MNLPCDIALYQQTENSIEYDVLIPETFPCVKSEKQTILMERVIPLQWSTMDTASLELNKEKVDGSWQVIINCNLLLSTIRRVMGNDCFLGV